MADTTRQDAEFLEQFEPDVFWQKHGKKIMVGVAAVVLIGAGIFYRQRLAAEAEEAAAAELSQARDAAALQRIAQDYRGKPLGGQALLRLANAQVQSGQYKEAGATFQQFLQSYASHPMAEAAQLGLAATQEAQGDIAGAKAQYQQLVNSHPNGYTAISAKLGLARCAEAAGLTKEAQQTYEELRPMVQGSSFEMEVYLRSMVLGRTKTESSTNAPALSIPDKQP